MKIFIVIILLFFIVGCSRLCPDGTTVGKNEACPITYCETDADCAHWDCSVSEWDKDCGNYRPHCDTIGPKTNKKFGYGDGKPFCECAPGWCV